MGDMRICTPYVEWQASNTIGILGRSFPNDRALHVFPEADTNHSPKIADIGKISLPQCRLSLVFDDNRLVFCAADTALREPNPWENWLLYFIMFKTSMNYNVCGLPRVDIQQRVALAAERELISFNLLRGVKRECGDGDRKGWYPDFEPEDVTLSRAQLNEFVDVANDELVLCMCYFLRGWGAGDYFLIEWYKVLETLVAFFGGQQKMNTALGQHGLNVAACRTLRKYANDEKRPLSIGRHAPKKGVRLVHIDIRSIFRYGVGTEVFEESSEACRNMIEAFSRYLEANRPEGR